MVLEEAVVVGLGIVGIVESVVLGIVKLIAVEEESIGLSCCFEAVVVCGGVVGELLSFSEDEDEDGDGLNAKDEVVLRDGAE